LLNAGNEEKKARMVVRDLLEGGHSWHPRNLPSQAVLDDASQIAKGHESASHQRKFI